MKNAALVFACALGAASAARFTDVPKGMCFKCEINCMQDCTAKFHEEVMKDDMTSFLQVAEPKPSSDLAKMPDKIVADYITRLHSASAKGCVKKQGCNLAMQCAKSVDNVLKARLQDEQLEHASQELDYGHDIHKKGKAWTDVASQEVTIADLPKFHVATDQHAHAATGAVSEHDLRTLDASHGLATRFGGHLRLISSKTNKTGLAPTGEAPDPFPLHPVKRQVFAKGQQTLFQCMQYCFAATCGCEDSPMTGTVSKTQELTKAAIASGFHTDTPPTWKYSRATKEQCGAGVKKLIKGLYIIYHAGPDGTYEVCSKGMFKAKAGVSGALGLTDPLEDMYKCDCGVNRLDCNEPDFGCKWNDKNNRCEFGAMHNTMCYYRYKTDKTL